MVLLHADWIIFLYMTWYIC